ncbi:MAG: UPF0179 family protein [Methanobacteriota archaeon]|nr:MAG: UPF0179 family protein [Euryarchaeota archaeon]
MVLVTVVGNKQCKEGFEFVFGGPLAECRDCKVRNVCFHLEENRRYKVRSVRDVQHDCRIHEDGVRVVEVEKIPLRAAIPARVALEGAMLTFEDTRCGNLSCANYRACRPLGASEGMRFKITSVDNNDVKCDKGLKLKAVLLE